MSIMDNMKDVVSLVQKIDNMELYKELITLQQEIYNLFIENQDLKEKIKDLEDKQKIQDELTYKENAYWRNTDGPFCTNCWDTKKLLVRLNSVDNIKGQCPNCKSHIVFDIKKHNEKERKALDELTRINNQTADYLNWGNK